MKSSQQENGALYRELITQEKDADGTVVMLHMDSAKLNTIKVQTVSDILQALRDGGTKTIWVPIGNLSGNLFLSGRGFRVPIKLLPVTSVEAEYKNEFLEAGINQTQHKIMMMITIHTGMFYPNQPAERTVELELCLAETILIGKVPQFYASIE